mgnify:CR=1 FL=1
MAVNVYEGMFIFDSNRYARDPVGTSSRLTELVESFGGEMLASRLWEERRLAYPINGHRKGTYWLTYFRLESTRLVELQRACQLEESIIRQLFLKIDHRIADHLVQLARGEVPAPVRQEEEPAEASS